MRREPEVRQQSCLMRCVVDHKTGHIATGPRRGSIVEPDY